MHTFVYLSVGCSGTDSINTETIHWRIVPSLDDTDDCGAINGMKERQVKPNYSEKTCPSAGLSTTDPTRLDLGSNPDRRGGKPELRHGLNA
jgi:hypothetical protein